MNAEADSGLECATPDECLGRKLTQRMHDTAEVLAERCMYTTTALEALAAFHERNDDKAGAALLLELAARFAAHECTVI